MGIGDTGISDFLPVEVPRMAASSGVASDVTGTTDETTLATITIPGGAIGANGVVIVTALWSVTNSGNGKVLRVKFGGTSFTSATVTTVATVQTQTIIRNANSAAAQVGYVSSLTNPFGNSANAIVTSTVNTAADVTLLITGQLASAGETITLRGYTVEIQRAQ